MNHLIASAFLAGYYIKLTKMQHPRLGFIYQVDYGADSIQYADFKLATASFKNALDHASELTYEQDMEKG